MIFKIFLVYPIRGVLIYTLLLCRNNVKREQKIRKEREGRNLKRNKLFKLTKEETKWVKCTVLISLCLSACDVTRLRKKKTSLFALLC